jgi:hypothetical protein
MVLETGISTMLRSLDIKGRTWSRVLSHQTHPFLVLGDLEFNNMSKEGRERGYVLAYVV